MQVVVEVDTKVYEHAKLRDALGQSSVYSQIIANGTPLPRCHGRLIDADKLDTRERGNNSQRCMWYNIKQIIDSAPTIIEADKESEECQTLKSEQK